MTVPYRIILFDFFNTLVDLIPSSLPILQLDGRKVVSTAGAIKDYLAADLPKLKAREVFVALEEAGRNIRSQWGEDLVEISALERFKLVVRILGLAGGDSTAKRLLDIHMTHLRGSFQFPESNRKLLEHLSEHFQLGLFSNCDHSNTVLRIIEDVDIKKFFNPIVISETIGYRKPGKIAFKIAMEATGESMDKILFVGDSLDDDVSGAVAVGLDVLWLNRKGEDKPSHLKSIPETGSLEGLLEFLETNKAR